MTARADTRRDPSRVPWHALPIDECLRRLGVAADRGLGSQEASDRLTRDGPNRLPAARGPTRSAVFVGQFRSVLVLLLVGAAVLLLVVSQVLDAVAVVAILLLNAGIGYMQERRAADALAALRRMTSATARVRRAGTHSVVPAEDLVTGDVVTIEAGDRVPADVRLLHAKGLRTDESALTGESEPTDKDAASLAREDAPVSERRGMAWHGTTAVAGTGEGVVVATGPATELGRIAAMVQAAEEPPTPLQMRLAALGRKLSLVCGVIVVLIFALGLARGLPVVSMLLAAVSLAVAAVPEGLPAVVTVALAVGVAKMARRNVLIRRLPAVETLGSTTVICADKTGTLTVGAMTVRAVASLDFEAAVAGDGYRPEGALTGDVDRARVVLRAAAACSTARLVRHGNEFTVAGDPTEGALVVAAMKAGFEPATLDADEPVIGGVPFDAGRRRMSVVRRAGGSVRIYLKGAPDSVLPRCAAVQSGDRTLPADDEARRHVLRRNDDLAARGLRVLAVAVRDLEDQELPDDVETGLTLLGLVGMADPPRESARGAVAACRSAGIRPVMITGDQASTALAIARELGIASSSAEVMSGPEIERASDDVLRERVQAISVYARASPEHKLRIVQAWRATGQVVAMTGDGVNDAPALRGADIGVAMGRGGTDVARDAAAMVVTDDDFASIVAAVEEGRRVFENIRKTLLYLLSGNLAEILVVAVSVASGSALALLPIQLLWVNLVTDGLPALALATDSAEPDLLRRPPRRPGTEIAEPAFLGRAALNGCVVAAVTLTAFVHGLRDGSDERARTLAFSVLVFAHVLLSIVCRSDRRTAWEAGLRGTAQLAAVIGVTVALQLWTQHSEALGAILHTVPLTWTESAWTLALAAGGAALLEGIKGLMARRARAARR